MAALTTEQRREIWAEAMREMSREWESCSVTKNDLLVVFNALDDWFDANASTINQAIPQPQRGQLTARQKARIVALILRARFNVGA